VDVCLLFSVLAENDVLLLSAVLIQTVVSCFVLHHERTENRAPSSRKAEENANRWIIHSNVSRKHDPVMKHQKHEEAAGLSAKKVER